MVSSSLKQQGQSPYASNWLERLRNIKRLRKKLLQEANGNNPKEGGTNDDVPANSNKRVHVDDFTVYTTFS